MSWMDYFVVYTIIGMVIMGNIFHASYAKIGARFGYTETIITTLALWLLSSFVWPVYLFYAIVIYKSRK